MTIYKICYRYLSAPFHESDEVHEILAPEGSMTFEHAIEPEAHGEYLVEYWTVDDSGKESAKQQTRLFVRQFEQPRPCAGGMFVSPVASSNVMDVQFNKANVCLKFSRAAEGLGYTFDWSDLDLRGLQIEQNQLSVPAGTWLHQFMLQNHASFDASFAGAKKSLYVQHNGQEYLVTDNAPSLVKQLVDKVEFKNGKLSFRVLRPATFIWK